MGLINKVLGASKAAREIGAAVEGISEVFVPNATKKLLGAQRNFSASMTQFGAEFQGDDIGGFDRFVNGLNRLPRPSLAFGTLGLFAYAMISPEGFSTRMQGLALVPEPLWWLLGAIVSFYFGAREIHYSRKLHTVNPGAIESKSRTISRVDHRTKRRSAPNAALTEWQTQSDR
jgi:hypothetical protein